MKETTAEHKLIAGCIKGDAASQQLLFKQYYGAMMQICKRYAGNQDEAKDLLQEGFIRIFDKLVQFNGKSSLQTWMNRVMVNIAIDYYHAQKKRLSSSLEEEALLLVEETETENPLMQLAPEKVLALLQELPLGYRTVLNMYAIEGYTHKEIALALKISEGTSKSQLAKARAMLLKRVEPLVKKVEA